MVRHNFVVLRINLRREYIMYNTLMFLLSVTFVLTLIVFIQEAIEYGKAKCFARKYSKRENKLIGRE